MKHFKQLSNDTGVFNNDSDPDKFMSSNLDMVDPVCEYYNSNDLHNVMMGTKQFLKIFFSNINSIPHKYDLLCEEFKPFFESQVDIIGFCESKLTDEIQHFRPRVP